MNFTNLRYFLEVAKDMSFTSAARTLCVSQQSLSGHISRLEEEFGVKLFERSPKLKLTYAGVNAMRMAKEIVDMESQFVTQLSDISGQRKGCLRIGISHMRSLVFLPEVLPEYNRLYPEVEVQLYIDVTKRLSEKLIDGDLDIVIGFNPFYKEIVEKVEFREILKENLCLVVPNRIMTEKYGEESAEKAEQFSKGVDLKEFADEPFLLVEKGNRIRDLSDRLFKKHGIDPRIILECSDLETLLLLCIKGMGVAFGFESVARMYGAGFVISMDSSAVIFPLKDEEVQGKIVIVHNKDRYLSLAARNFIDLAESRYMTEGQAR